MADAEKVRVRDCACPGTPHNGEGDWVLLAPTLSLEAGLAAEQDLREINAQYPEDERSNALQRRWVVTFVKYGAKGWNLQGEDGDLPFDVDAILADYGLAQPVADRAADLYTDAVLRPFQTRLAARSPTGQTSDTTSHPPARTRKSSARSSPATTAATPQQTP